MKKYGFIIDTTQYAGNFEREMCAFLTGKTGDCGVGAEIAEDFYEEFPVEFKEIEKKLLVQLMTQMVILAFVK